MRRVSGAKSSTARSVCSRRAIIDSINFASHTLRSFNSVREGLRFEAAAHFLRYKYFVMSELETSFLVVKTAAISRIHVFSIVSLDTVEYSVSGTRCRKRVHGVSVSK